MGYVADELKSYRNSKEKSKGLEGKKETKTKTCNCRKGQRTKEDSVPVDVSVFEKAGVQM